MNKIIIAIDPGASGGIAVYELDVIVIVYKMPETPMDLCDLVDGPSNIPRNQIKAYVEEVGGYVGDAGQPGSAMFNFGKGYGEIIGILTHAKIPFELVRPQKWQKGLGIASAGYERVDYRTMNKLEADALKKQISARNAVLKREHKNKLKELAQRFFPDQKVTLNNCDALLLLEWAMRQENMPAVPVPQKEMAL